MQCENVEIPPEAGTRTGCRTQKVNIKKQRKKYRKEEEYENEKVIFKNHELMRRKLNYPSSQRICGNGSLNSRE